MLNRILARKRSFSLIRGWVISILFSLVAAPGLVRSQEVTTVILVRHAEKDRAEGVRDPNLTAEGHTRAAELVHALQSLSVTAIYSTPFNRTRQTAAPVAEFFGLDVVTTMPGATYYVDMVNTIREDHRGGVVIVVGHSNTTPAMVNALIGTSIPQIDDDKNDDLFVVTINADNSGSVVRLAYGSR